MQYSRLWSLWPVILFFSLSGCSAFVGHLEKPDLRKRDVPARSEEERDALSGRRLVSPSQSRKSGLVRRFEEIVGQDERESARLSLSSLLTQSTSSVWLLREEGEARPCQITLLSRGGGRVARGTGCHGFIKGANRWSLSGLELQFYGEGSALLATLKKRDRSDIWVGSVIRSGADLEMQPADRR